MGVKLKQMLVERWRGAVHSFRTNSLFRNAVYLMLSTAIMSVLGFGFWLFVAHLYAPAAIGSASALISIALLISYISYLGLNAGIVRFLAKSENPSGDINASLAVVGAVSIAAAGVALAVAGPVFSGPLAVFTSNWLGRVVFMTLMAVVSLNTLTDSIFIANRRAELHTAAYAVFGLVKLIAPLFLLALGSMGVFIAFIAAAMASLALSLYLMVRYCAYRPLTAPNWRFIAKSRRYTMNNYLASIMTALPGQLMPTIILTRLGEAQTAYFSMAWTMVNLLYVVPSAVTNSLLAESSHDSGQQGQHLSHAVRILAYILLPAVLVSVAVAPYLLSLFGYNYAHYGTGLFQVLAVATFFLAANSVGTTIMNLEHRTGSIVVVQAVIAATTLGLAELLAGFGLEGIGLSIMGGMVVGAVMQLIILSRGRQQQAVLDEHGNVVYTGPAPEVIQLAFAAFDLAGASYGQDVGGGDRSGTWLVNAGDRGRYVLKLFADSKRSRADLGRELYYISCLRQAGVPVPSFIRDVHGGEVSTIGQADNVWQAVVMSFEAGREAREYSESLVRDMAAWQAKMHVVGQSVPAKWRPSGVKDGSFRSALLRFLPKGVSHFDYYIGNVLSDGQRVTSVIDFEGVRYDPFVVCLFFSVADVYEQSRKRKFVQQYLSAYQETRRLGRGERVVLRLNLALRFGSLWFLTARW
ncbi:MAG TPA: phosphotransferase [Candidatus Saccharimonadia bacterium]